MIFTPETDGSVGAFLANAALLLVVVVGAGYLINELFFAKRKKKVKGVSLKQVSQSWLVIMVVLLVVAAIIGVSFALALGPEGY